jgi:hypothetical protein
MASTGVFVRVIFALKSFISSFSQTPRMAVTYLKHMKSNRHQKMDPREICTRRGDALKKQKAKQE